MKTKKSQIIVLLGFILSLTVAIFFLKKGDDSKVSARDLFRNLSTPTPYPTAVSGLPAQILEKYAKSKILTSSVNGIEISTTNFRLEKNEVKIDVCFQVPNNNDWIYKDVSINVGELKILASQFTLFEMTDTLLPGQKRITRYLGDSSQFETNIVPSDGLPNYRCDAIIFRLETEVTFSEVTLTIEAIVGSPREGEVCYEYRDTVQSILNARSTGIKVDCAQNDFEFGSKSQFIIVEKPASMTDEEANQMISSAFQEFFTIVGPWTFTSTVEQ